MTSLAAHENLTEVAEGVLIRPMLTIDDAIDFCCFGLAQKTRKDYAWLLYRFAATFPKHTDVAKVTEQDCLRFLNASRHLAKGTQAWQETVLDGGFFKKLYRAQKIKKNPMEFVPRTRRPNADTLDLKTISSGEVSLMMDAAETWAERLCIGILAYLGPRRAAASQLRLRDYDRSRGRLRFHEKGGKTIWKPVPHELHTLIAAAMYAGVYDSDETMSEEVDGEVIEWTPLDLEAYLIPSEGPLVRSGNRDDRVIWRLVKKVAKRAGVDSHTHSIRAAFADFYLDSGGDGKALQLLMGHNSPETTERYTRRFDKERRMEGVRGLSWASVGHAEPDEQGGRRAASDAATPEPMGNPGLASGSALSFAVTSQQFAGKALDESAVMGAGGFEPPQAEPPLVDRAGSLLAPDSFVSDLLGSLLERAARARV